MRTLKESILSNDFDIDMPDVDFKGADKLTSELLSAKWNIDHDSSNGIRSVNLSLLRIIFDTVDTNISRRKSDVGVEIVEQPFMEGLKINFEWVDEQGRWDLDVFVDRWDNNIHISKYHPYSNTPRLKTKTYVPKGIVDLLSWLINLHTKK